MKKLLATILAFVYLSTSMGAILHLHYCMGKLASWSLIEQERNSCAHCGMVIKKIFPKSIGIKKNCCRDEEKQIKTGLDQKLTSAEIWKSIDFPLFIAIEETITQSIIELSFNTTHPRTHAPPLVDKLSRFILYGNFRI